MDSKSHTSFTLETPKVVIAALKRELLTRRDSYEMYLERSVNYGVFDFITPIKKIDGKKTEHYKRYEVVYQIFLPSIFALDTEKHRCEYVCICIDKNNEDVFNIFFENDKENIHRINNICEMIIYIYEDDFEKVKRYFKNISTYNQA